jgi:hypothetical protein
MTTRVCNSGNRIGGVMVGVAFAVGLKGVFPQSVFTPPKMPVRPRAPQQ